MFNKLIHTMRAWKGRKKHLEHVHLLVFFMCWSWEKEENIQTLNYLQTTVVDLYNTLSSCRAINKKDVIMCFLSCTFLFSLPLTHIATSTQLIHSQFYSLTLWRRTDTVISQGQVGDDCGELIKVFYPLTNTLPASTPSPLSNRGSFGTGKHRV